MQFSKDDAENQRQWSICSFQRMKQRIRSLQQQWPRKTAACLHSPGQLAPAVLCGWLPHCRMPANTNVLSCKRVLICKVLTAKQAQRAQCRNNMVNIMYTQPRALSSSPVYSESGSYASLSESSTSYSLSSAMKSCPF